MSPLEKELEDAGILPKIILPEGSEEKLDKIIDKIKERIDEQERILHEGK